MLRSALLAFTRGRKVPRTGYTVLTPKRGPRDYYKGKGAQPTGKHTRKGAAHLPSQTASLFVVKDTMGSWTAPNNDTPVVLRRR